MYGVRASFSLQDKTLFVIHIRSGKVNFFRDCLVDFFKTDIGYIPVNRDHPHLQFSGVSLEFLQAVIKEFRQCVWNNSLPFYIEITIGRWNKPYVYRPPFNE
jgi:hypothetical protein